MSFRHNVLYVIQAKREICNCSELDREFAELLFTEPSVYRNSEVMANRVVVDEDHERTIKLLFLCDMRQEYNEHFFGGNAPLTIEFFDRWWELTKTDEAEDIETVAKRIKAEDFDAVASIIPPAASERLKANR